MLELRHLRAFVVLSEELNFTRAAARVFVTQPALSHQIQRLEQEVGLTLFTRTSRSVSLTDDGRRFLVLARQVLQTLDHGLRDLRQEASAPLLRVGFADYIGYTVIPERLQHLRDHMPTLQIRHVEGSTLEQLRGLQNGSLDVGFFVAAEIDEPGLTSHTLWRENLMLALPEGHPLAALEHVPLTALNSQRMLVNAPQSSPDMTTFQRNLFARLNIQPEFIENPGSRIYSLAGIMRLVAENEGLFLLFESFQKLSFPGVAFRALQGNAPGLPLRMVWRGTLSSSLQGLLRQVFQGDGESDGNLITAAQP